MKKHPVMSLPDLEPWLNGKNIAVSAGDKDSLILETEPLRCRFIAACLEKWGVDSTVEGKVLHIPIISEETLEGLQLALEPQLICLDVDGCLIDVSQSFDAVVKQTVACYDDGPVSRDDILAFRAAGGYNDDIVLSRELLRRRGKPVDLEELTTVFRDFYFGNDEREGLYKTETPLISADLLTQLQETVPIALVTGRNRAELELAFPILNLDPKTISMTVDDVAEGKPHPEGILTAAAKFRAKRIWMLGDNKDDILAALRADAVAIGVSVENRSALEAAGAALVLDHINQLEELI